MKLKVAFAAATITLLGATVAQAQLVIELDNPVQRATSPGFVTFNGLIRNAGNDTIVVTGDSLSAPAGVGIDLPQSDLILGVFPKTFGPGDSLYGDWLFGLDIPASQTTSFGGTYAVIVEDEAGNPLTPVTADYRVNIQGVPPTVPEPGTMALLVSGLIGGSLLMKRRRK